MSQSPYFETRFRFEFDLADRMRKALRVADMGVSQIAAEMNVGRNTVSTWINGKITPDRFTVKRFAEITGAPYEWLMNGETPSPDDDDGAGMPSRLGESNSRPIHYESTPFSLVAA